MASGDLETARSKLLSARDNAGQDPELRYRAAYNLALAFARSADEKKDEAQEAMSLLRQSAGWFQDAVKLRPEEESARQNLELILRRIQALADQLNKGKNGLEARLARAIEDQRGLRDNVRGLLAVVESKGADPLSQRDAFITLATNERALFADTGIISDLAGDELDGLNNKPEDQLTEEDQVRKVQLANLDHYLQKARTDIDDCRRLLRDLNAKRALSRAAQALEALKRAREQLLDPVTVLKGITQEQTQLLQHTVAILEFEAKKMNLEGETKKLEVPAWLAPEHLSERQAFLISRTEELVARFRAGVEAPPQTDETAPQDPKQKRMLANAKEALPLLEDAQRAMSAAKDKLDVGQIQQAAEPQGRALTALYKAIEIFSDIRNLIELAYADHGRVEEFLAATTDDSKALSAADRRAAVDAGLARNLDRFQRLSGLFADELEILEAQAAAQQGQQPGADDHGGDGQKQLYAQAEVHRKAAAEATARLRKLAATSAKETSATSAEARKELEELRRLFYSIIEHLKELHQRQTETHDSTATAEEADDTEKAALLGPILESQKEHASVSDSLAAALEKQSDQAASSEDEKAADQAERTREAAAEVRLAQSEMQVASDQLSQAQTDAEAMSVTLEPTLESQPKALEHLENAIRLLQPPKQNENQDQQDQEQKQDQGQGEQDQQEEVSKQQAQKRLQAIRDREAERQRKKRDQERSESQPVEKDW
jgi:hypothetical protein